MRLGAGTMFGKFVTSESGATLVEYGVAMLLAISAGGAVLVTLSNQTGTNMEAACDVLQVDGRVQNTCNVDGG